MKKYVMILITALSLLLSTGELQAQKKKVVKKSARTNTVKFTEKSYGSPTTITEVTDITEASPGYEAEKNLIENYGVTITYSDNTFKGKEPLRRGDFIVGFNSALGAIKKAMDAASVDSLINTYDKNASYITSVNDIKDLKPTSVYYPAVQSLIEKWGIAAPFTKAKLLNPGGVMTEAEVYDILKVTLGYTSPGSNPYTKAMNRDKFATILNNAISQKITEVNAMSTTKRVSAEDERRSQDLAFKMAEKERKDTAAKGTELRRMEAQKTEAQAWSKLSDSQKRKLHKVQTNK
jgi:hypothetical protein